MGILDRLVIATLPAVPRPIMRRLSDRYIAGETLADALGRLANLKSRGYPGVLDILGEDVTDETAARDVATAYEGGASAIHAAGIDAYVSIKPTHMGLRISEELCEELYGQVLAHCKPLGQMVRVEMEDHTTTDATLAIFKRLHAVHDNVSIVLQSRLFRTADDIDALSPACDVRIVKGIYLEPAEIAHTEYDDIRASLVTCTERLFDRGHTVAIGTHDEVAADRILQYAAEKSIDRERYYFEVLLGVQAPLWERWKAAGNVVRVYVPYGPEWRSYSQRRLRKNPEILGHIIRNVFRA